ncbi:hypothetical protein V6U77_11960 [Micromonospora sp. CPCC 205546]
MNLARADDDPYEEQPRLCTPCRVATSPAYATSLGENYVGLPTT